MSEEQPAFEIVVPGGMEIKIHADGRVSGLEAFGTVLIINRIPQIIEEARCEIYKITGPQEVL